MFTIDERIRGIPAGRDQVVALYQSINSPHLAIPGKQAGPAQGFIVGVRGPSGFGVFVYLYLADVGDCAVYAGDQRNLNPEEYDAAEAEAMAFVESMGFMMDNTNFRTLSPARQEELLKTLPVFQKEPRRSATAAAKQQGGTPARGTQVATGTALARLFTSF